MIMSDRAGLDIFSLQYAYLQSPGIRPGICLAASVVSP